MGLRDLVHKMPETRKELSDYVIKNNRHVKKLIEKNPDYKSALEEAVSSTFDKYSEYLKGWKNKLSGAGHVVGYTADAWLFATGDIIGTLGGKFINFLAQMPEKAYSLAYAVRTGNYLDAAQNILEGALSYIPGLTFADQGLTRIIQKRMASDALTKFEKEVGIYKSWTAKVADTLKGLYKGVKDRAKNVFTPVYEPKLALQRA